MKMGTEKNKDYPNIFVISYGRSNNIKTLYYFAKRQYDMDKIHIVIDNEEKNIKEYREACEKYGCKMHIFNIDDARLQYDYVYRKNRMRRAAGQARNAVYDIAEKEGITQYVVMDDDTTGFQYRENGKYINCCNIDTVVDSFILVLSFCRKHHIGIFGLSQTGDFYGQKFCNNLLRKKVMNTTFVTTDYVYKGERGEMDNDTSQFVEIHNNGLFTGSLWNSVVLKQTLSIKSKGGLTEAYKELKLLRKSLITPIQLPSCIIAKKQKQNGNRLHHFIDYNYLCPKILKIKDKSCDNIQWDTYDEDVKFTRRRTNLNVIKK